MIIPLHHPRVEAGRSRRAVRRAITPLRSQFAQAARVATVATRLFLLVLGAVAWGWAQPGMHGLLGLGMVLAAGSALFGAFRPFSFWVALSADTAVVALLLHATGGLASPLLLVTLVLILQGALLGDWRDTLAATGTSVIVLMSLALAQTTVAGNAGVLALAQIGFGSLVAWGTRRGHTTLELLIERVEAQERPDQAFGAGQLLEWQRRALALAACDSAESLRDEALACAAAIGGVNGELVLPGELLQHHLNDTTMSRFVIPGEPVNGALLVPLAPHRLDAVRQAALEYLALQIGLRAAAFQRNVHVERHHNAVMSIWEAAAVLRAAPGTLEPLRDACGRVAVALDLGWLALIAPDARRALAPLVMSPGRREAEAPRLHGAQLRMAAETLRSGRPLVRQEQACGTLVCLPVRIQGETVLVLAAQGETQDAGTQALLLLFADMIADRLCETPLELAVAA